MPLDIIVFLAALTVLVVTARLIIKFLSRAATAFGISEFALAFVLLAVATSLPELSIGISSARQGAGDLVLAVALGSNIINATLVIGLAAFLSLGISTSGLNLRRDILLGAVITTLPILFLIDGTISSLEGTVLLAAFVYYLLLLYRDSRGRPKQLRLPHLGHGFLATCAVLVLLIILIYAANYTVSSAVSIARVLSIPAVLIGVLLIALGTSLPELTIAVQAALKRQPGLALGNIIGSNIANSALIIGTASLVQPLVIENPLPLITTAVFVLISTALLGIFAVSRRRLSTREGVVLIALFFLFFVVTLTTTLANAG